MDLNSGSNEVLTFGIGVNTYVAKSFSAVTLKKDLITCEVFETVISSIKEQCCDATKVLIQHPSRCCSYSKLMNALGIAFPQFWCQPNSKDLFLLHMKT